MEAASIKIWKIKIGVPSLAQKKNSYSKSNADTTFMRMKEDHMQNGRLRLGYNAPISNDLRQFSLKGIEKNRIRVWLVRIALNL